MPPRGIAAIPGMPGESIDQRLLPDIEAFIKKYKVKISDGYAASGHEAGGDHPKGLAADIVPDFRRGGTWADVGRLAEEAKKHPEIFRWVGWNGSGGSHGDPAHGGNHLHLSWHGGGTNGDTKPLKLATGSLSRTDVFGDGGPLNFGQPKEIAGDAADATANAIVGIAKKALSDDGARILLYIGFVIGGAVLALVGVARMGGLKPRDLVNPAAAAMDLAKPK